MTMEEEGNGNESRGNMKELKGLNTRIGLRGKRREGEKQPLDHRNLKLRDYEETKQKEWDQMLTIVLKRAEKAKAEREKERSLLLIST
ncbi:hypothetical protein AAHA92_22717 [Salvia divinorum]|uniref:Uncharacterized protein n=1 Tax=Salvia divinorum TaxID=28513 RepID=A0ABD1GPK8_SALDI